MRPIASAVGVARINAFGCGHHVLEATPLTGQSALPSIAVSTRRLLALISIAVGAAAVAAIAWSSLAPRATIFDEAFSTFQLDTLEDCAGFADQHQIFLSERGDLTAANEEEVEMLRQNWARFLSSERGEEPSGCQWVITPYPAAFIATGKATVIVLNPSNTVVGAPLPEGTTGDFVMDATRYSEVSLGAFRGAATIPPRSIAVIALR